MEICGEGVLEPVGRDAVIHWQYYPRGSQCPSHLTEVVGVFRRHGARISSDRKRRRHSNAVLSIVARDLKQLDYHVETGKRREEKVTVPVLFGRNGEIEKSFDADAYNKNRSTVIEVEAASAVTGNQFLKDLFQASMMEGVQYCVIAVRNRSKATKDFDTVCRFMDTMYASDRLRLPLDGILILGY
jgi:hypothetical protein